MHVYSNAMTMTHRCYLLQKFYILHIIFLSTDCDVTVHVLAINGHKINILTNVPIWCADMY